MQESLIVHNFTAHPELNAILKSVYTILFISNLKCICQINFTYAKKMERGRMS